jgi:hypothetical protein
MSSTISRTVLQFAAYEVETRCIISGEMKAPSKLARQKKAARQVAELMYASLQQFPEEEQNSRMKKIHKIALEAGIKPNRKPSKRSSTRANPRVSRPASRVR